MIPFYRLFLFLIFSFTTTLLLAQPANDECATSINLGLAPQCPLPDIYTNVGATASVISSDPSINKPACFNNSQPDNDVWFVFTTPNDGSIPDIIIEVTGVAGTNDAMSQPQIAAYRGECGEDELAEIGCVTSLLNESFVSLELTGISAGSEIYIRIEDWTASATPNEGDFSLCVKAPDPVFNMGETSETSLCNGVLFDSGGPDGDYSTNEDLTFTVCPADNFTCVEIELTSFNTESNFDEITIYGGATTGDPIIGTFDGAGGPVNLLATPPCFTVRFTSDGSAQQDGFELTWSCSNEMCFSDPVTCDDPIVIATLPYALNDATTCGALNSVTDSGPCANETPNGEDYVFAYESEGNECVEVSVLNVNPGSLLSVYNDCPDAATECISNFMVSNNGSIASPVIRLEDPGTYYFVLDARNGCTFFDIVITAVVCPITVPSASNCEDILPLNGCDESVVQSVNIPQMPSTDEFAFQDGINDGCWSGTGQDLYTWFTFQAQADGTFGFLISNAIDPEFSDIDLQVWGPIINNSELCDYVYTNQPIRSTWAASTSSGLTGLVDENPNDGSAVTDICEGAGGDGFVSTIEVMEGQWYVILINDFSGNSGNGGVSIDFSGTTNEVLNEIVETAVSANTQTCPGVPVELEATGGIAYNWAPATGLSCISCPNPTALVNAATTYEVTIATTCNTEILTVEVGLLSADAGEDQTICQGEPVTISATPDQENFPGTWQGMTDALSCTDCANPTVNTELLGPGTFEFIYAVGSIADCLSSDTINITILATPAPQFEIAADTAFCGGGTGTITLGGTDFSETNYSWTSFPAGFTSNQANPSVTPTETTTYFLEVTNDGCPRTIIDSVKVSVGLIPQLPVIADVAICGNTNYQLLANNQPDVVYTWTPNTGVANPNTLANNFTPNQTTTYTVVADNNGCINETSFTIEVGNTELLTLVASNDNIVCQGTPMNLEASANLAGTYSWSDGTTGPLNNFIADISIMLVVTFTPEDPCYGVQTENVNLTVFPLPTVPSLTDQLLCNGDSYIFQAPQDPGVAYLWTPNTGVNNPFGLDVEFTPTQTTSYTLTANLNGCEVQETFTITVGNSEAIELTYSEDMSICGGNVVDLTAGANVPGEISWPGGITGGNFTSEILNATTTIPVTFTPDDACQGAITENILITVTPQPQAPNLDNQEICEEESYELAGLTVEAGVIYSWSPTEGVADPASLNTTFNPISSTTYTLTADNNICVNNTSFDLGVAENPTFTTIGDLETCGGGDQAIALTASASLPGTFTWMPGALTGDEVSVMPMETTIYTVSFAADNGCPVDDQSIAVTVFEGVSITEDITYDPTEDISVGTAVTLNVTTNLTSGLSYEWSEGSTTRQIMVTPLEIPEATYTVTVTDENGCTDEATVTFPVLDSAYGIPNAFAPNGDGDNEQFGVEIIGGNIEIISAQIFNRFGELIHEGSGNAHLWNGQMGSDAAPSDVYIYVFEIRMPDGEVVMEKGDVTLIR